MVRVEVKRLSKSFGEVNAVNDVSFEINDGTFFFLLGPSGCGKTTLLRLIAGFEKPSSGEIYIGDRFINNLSPNKRNIGMVFQNYALWPHMTVYDNVVYGLRIRGVPQAERVERAKKMLSIVKMGDYAMRYPNQLSGGQQQRIALARALVVEPEVLLLDEPLSNLDAKLRLETRDEIRRIQKETQVTSIYVTHDQEEALSMADEIAIMNAGRIEQLGMPQEVYNNPTNAFVANFLGNTNILECQVVESKAPEVFSLEWTGGGTLYVSKPGLKLKNGQKVLCAIRPEKFTLSDSQPLVSNLHNFLKVKIQALIYYGLMEQYSLLSDKGVELKATNFNPNGHQRQVGDTIYLVFKHQDLWIYPTGEDVNV